MIFVFRKTLDYLSVQLLASQVLCSVNFVPQNTGIIPLSRILYDVVNRLRNYDTANVAVKVGRPAAVQR